MEEILRKIKADFRANMNGVASAHMRESGLSYHVNFGIELPRLQEIAKEVRAEIAASDAAGLSGQSGIYGKNSLPKVAQQLWMENVRESKIVAAMLMPTEYFTPELADLWAEQIPNAEIAQTTTLYLFTRLPYASSLIFPWLASERELLQLCGLLLATRMIIQGKEFNEDSMAELVDQAHSLLDSPNLHVRKAAQNLVARI